MACLRVLYICFDPRLLVTHEKALLKAGYDVVTILGVDGISAHKATSDYDYVVLGEGSSVEERERTLAWLHEHLPNLHRRSLWELAPSSVGYARNQKLRKLS